MSLPTNLRGRMVIAVASLVVGWVRDLHRQLKQKAGTLQEEIVKRKRAEELLTYETRHEPLTNLPNRRFFLERLGHAAGDQLLIEVARRLKTSVRVVDTVARMGGDELAIFEPRLPAALPTTPNPSDLR